MAGFISGLLGAAGQALEKKEQRKYTEAKEERDRKRNLVTLAAQQAMQQGMYDQLPILFGEMDDLGVPDGAPKGEKAPHAKMGTNLAKMLKMREQQEQQGQAQQQARADVQGAPGVTAQPAPQGVQPGVTPSTTPPFVGDARGGITGIGPRLDSQQQAQLQQYYARNGGSPTPPMPPPQPVILGGRPNVWQQLGTRMKQKKQEDEEEEFQTKLKHEGMSFRGMTQQQLEKVEQLKQHFIDKEHLDEKTASEEANLAVFGSALKKPGGGGLQKVWIKRPGSDDPEQVWVDPHNKEAGFFDMKDGKPIPPEGIESSGPPTKDRLMQAIQGYYYHYIRQGYGHKDALGMAGDDFREYQGKHLARLEQQMMMDQFKSSIGPGKGFSQPNTPVPVKPTAQPGASPAPQSQPQPGNVPRGTPAMPPPRITRPAVAAGPSATTAPLRSTLNPQELENADYFIGTLAGTQKGTGNAAIRTQLGQRAAMKVGLTPEVLTARAERRKATAKATEKITTIVDSVDGLEKALARHGTVLTQLRPQLPDTDVKKLNEWLTSGAIEFNVKGVSEAAVRYGLALQAVRNEYGRVIAGGAASAGTTPVEAMREAGEKMSGGFTTGNTKAMVNQLGIEAKQKSGGYREQLKEMQDEMSQPLAPELRGGKYQEIQQTPPPGAGASGGLKRKVWNEATQSFEER